MWDKFRWPQRFKNVPVEFWKKIFKRQSNSKRNLKQMTSSWKNFDLSSNEFKRSLPSFKSTLDFRKLSLFCQKDVGIMPLFGHRCRLSPKASYRDSRFRNRALSLILLMVDYESVVFCQLGWFPSLKALGSFFWAVFTLLTSIQTYRIWFVAI